MCARRVAKLWEEALVRIARSYTVFAASDSAMP